MANIREKAYKFVSIAAGIGGIASITWICAGLGLLPSIGTERRTAPGNGTEPLATLTAIAMEADADATAEAVAHILAAQQPTVEAQRNLAAQSPEATNAVRAMIQTTTFTGNASITFFGAGSVFVSSDDGSYVRGFPSVENFYATVSILQNYGEVSISMPAPQSSSSGQAASGERTAIDNLTQEYREIGRATISGNTTNYLRAIDSLGLQYQGTIYTARILRKNAFVTVGELNGTQDTTIAEWQFSSQSDVVHTSIIVWPNDTVVVYRN